MTPDIDKKIFELLTLEKRCFDEKEHDLKPFIYEDKSSDFVKICMKAGCGQYYIEQEGIYFFHGLLHYVDSDEYRALVKTSEDIKNSLQGM